MLNQKRHTLSTWVSSGELWIWMNAAAVGLSIAAVSGLLILIAVRGLEHFWPTSVSRIMLVDDVTVSPIIGEFVKAEDLSVEQYRESSGDTSISPDQEFVTRWLIKTGNRRIDPPDFGWIFTHHIDSIDYPEEVVVIERNEWGNAYGFLKEVQQSGVSVDASKDVR